MNKEQIIDEAYENYEKNVIKSHKENGLEGFNYLTKDSFIERIETDPEFSEKWGLKIEEKELSAVERMEYYGKHFMKETDSKTFDELCQIDYDKLNIPTKLITLTYNNETIESYE